MSIPLHSACRQHAHLRAVLYSVTATLHSYRRAFICEQQPSIRSLIWKQGMTNWLALQEIEEFKGFLGGNTPPPLPTIAEHKLINRNIFQFLKLFDLSFFNVRLGLPTFVHGKNLFIRSKKCMVLIVEQNKI